MRMKGKDISRKQSGKVTSELNLMTDFADCALQTKSGPCLFLFNSTSVSTFLLQNSKTELWQRQYGSKSENTYSLVLDKKSLLTPGLKYGSFPGGKVRKSNISGGLETWQVNMGVGIKSQYSGGASSSIWVGWRLHKRIGGIKIGR